MADLSELHRLVIEQGQSIEQFKNRVDLRLERIDSLDGEVAEILKKQNRFGLVGGGSFESAEDREHKQAFLSYLRSGREGSIQTKGMLAGDDPSGGYLVPTQIDAEITKFLREQSPMRQLARVVQPETADFSMIHSVGGTGYTWVGETSSRPETDSPAFQEIKPKVGEIYSQPGATQRLLDDNGFDLENWLVEEVSEALAAGESEAFITGNGIERPRGILTYDVSSAADGARGNNDLQYTPSGSAGAFAGTNPADALVSLVHSLRPRYRRGASWLLNTDTLEQVRLLKDGQGNFIWRAGVEAGQPDSLLGFPVYEDENMPAISANSLSIAFGNFRRAYVIVDRTTTLLRDPFTVKGRVLFYVSKRVGGAVRDSRALKLLKFAAS